MRFKVSASLLLFCLFSLVQTTYAKPNSEALARHAISSNRAEAAAAIDELRKLGPEGLSALFQIHAAEINRQVNNPLLASTPEWRRLSAALDAVSQQKNSYLSGLYWYTDFVQAKAVAQASGKPILSLRLLGNLSEEFSCANSRFFRTILYSNSDIAKELRDHFVLHWQSVRPAPRVTIDFGDGRKLERTLTGNSIHYILDSNGRLIDGLPGLYGPAAFLRKLHELEAVSQSLRGKGDAIKTDILYQYHNKSVNQISRDWLQEIKLMGGRIPSMLTVRNDKDGRAIVVAPSAITKAITETSILRSITAGAEELGRVTDEAAWTKIALGHIDDAKLDDQSIGLLRRQTQKLIEATEKSQPNLNLKKLLEKLQVSIALDTVRNEYLMHSRLHAWLMVDSRRLDLNLFNEKVYAELFRTPSTDPWLGLFSADTYVALENGGLGK